MKVHILLGTKAELIKMAGVLKELDNRKIKYNFIHTGQHTKTGLELIEIFGLKNPDFWITKRTEDLKTPLEALGWAMKCIIQAKKNKIFEKGDLILVHGDTESTLIGTIIAKITGCKLVHIEGGLRSFDIFDPFPEEIIRRITDRLSKYIFCTSEWSCKNLKKEKNKANIHNIKSNTVDDAVTLLIKKTKSKNIPNEKFAILMLHRKETIYNKKRLEAGIKIIEKIANKMKTVFILSKNSEYVLRKVGAYDKIKKHPNIIITDYYDYASFMHLTKKCEFIAADSGGVQEETYALNKPYLILRKKTERHEGLNETAFISYLDIKKIDYFLENYNKFKRKSITKKESPSKLIVDKLEKIKNER